MRLMIGIMNSMKDKKHSKLSGVLCTICKESVVEAYKPFCSKRCADLDLHQWLNGGYAIPAVESEEEGFPETELEH